MNKRTFRLATLTMVLASLLGEVAFAAKDSEQQRKLDFELGAEKPSAAFLQRTNKLYWQMEIADSSVFRCQVKSPLWTSVVERMGRKSPGHLQGLSLAQFGIQWNAQDGFGFVVRAPGYVDDDTKRLGDAVINAIQSTTIDGLQMWSLFHMKPIFDEPPSAYRIKKRGKNTTVSTQPSDLVTAIYEVDGKGAIVNMTTLDTAGRRQVVPEFTPTDDGLLLLSKYSISMNEDRASVVAELANERAESAAIYALRAISSRVRVAEGGHKKEDTISVYLDACTLRAEAVVPAGDNTPEKDAAPAKAGKSVPAR